MSTSALSESYLHLTNMTSQVENYMNAVEDNIKGSSPYWNVSDAVINDAKGHLDKAREQMMTVIRWAENARDICYVPSKEECAQLIEFCDDVKLHVMDMEVVFQDRITPVAPPEWVEKIQIFTTNLLWYIRNVRTSFIGNEF